MTRSTPSGFPPHANLRYDLRYETRAGRCAWCWEPLPAAQSHAVVRTGGAHPLELRFHHRCWPIYRGLSGIEGEEARALYREWPPQRIEALRLHAGMNMHRFASALHISRERLARVLSGEARLGHQATARLRGLAVDTRFERQEEGAGLIDWSDRRAVFSLCMHLGWTAGQLGSALGVRDTTVTSWWDRGCPKQSVAAWNRLGALAREHGFDAGMLVGDRLWTPELGRAAFERSGLTRAAFAAAAGCHVTLVTDAIQGRRRFSRQMAYYLTRAAARLGLPLPPEGRIGPKRRAPRPFPGGHRGPQGGQVWRPEELAVLGTVPDQEAAARLSTRSYVAAMRMRRALGIPKVPARGWEGTPRACPVPLGEVLRRYYSRLGLTVPSPGQDGPGEGLGDLLPAGGTVD